jgi:large subunit ribosomal protein L18
VSIISKQNRKIARRKLRVRQHLAANKFTLPRLTVFKSLSNIYAQIIDDAKHQTLVSCSTIELVKGKTKITGDKKELARLVGKELAERAKSKGIEAAFFDRGSALYHGRVKSLAEGAREGGLKI